MSQAKSTSPIVVNRSFGRYVRLTIGLLVLTWMAWRLYTVLIVEKSFGPDTWLRLGLSGLIIGGMYALIAIGYSLVYGVLGMINFAHGDVMMIGTFGGYFVIEALRNIKTPTAENLNLTFLNANPVISILIAFIVGMGIASGTGYLLEKIAYRPLRNAPRLVPLISAIGASIFLENAAYLLFGSQNRAYQNPDIITRGVGITLSVNNSNVLFSYTGLISIVLSITLMLVLFTIVSRTRLGRAMRAVAQDKKTAALMGVNVDDTISKTFLISGALAGAAGVMLGFYAPTFNYLIGFLPGIKAFTAAVLGGIGNIPGAMIGGVFLGLIESLGPAGLGINFQLKDVIAFSILVLVLIFRPSGILGEAISEEKL